jgi:hypothetical protein
LQAIVITERDVIAVREPEFNYDVEDLVTRVADDEDFDEEDDNDISDISYSFLRPIRMNLTSVFTA